MVEGVSKILLADDDMMVRGTVSKILEMFGHQVIVAPDGKQALDLVDDSFDVIILDINMPDMNGFETLEELNSRDLEIPVLFLTGMGSMDNAVKAIKRGAYDFLTKPIEDLDIFNVQIHRALDKRVSVLRRRRDQKALEEKNRKIAEQKRLVTQELEEKKRQLENATIQFITSLQNAMEAKDEYTAGHTKRVTDLAVMIGKEKGLKKEELEVLRRAAQFHDIGKLVIDQSCIQKAGKLDDHEWELIRKHPVAGAYIIKPLDFMKQEQFIIRHHHERVDGTGYPDGLTGDQLDDMTKILIVADSYDAMTSYRQYQKSRTMAEAIAELRRCAGTQFDPDTVEIFAQKLPEIMSAQETDPDIYFGNLSFNLLPRPN